MDSNTLSILGIIIPSVIAVISIIVSVVLYLKQKNTKELSYEVVSSAYVASVASNVNSKVKLFFEDQPVTRTVKLLVIRLINTGNQPIKRNDYDVPIEFQFNISKGKILEAEIAESIPGGASLDKNTALLADGKIRLPSLLINQKEELRFSVLVEGEVSLDKVEGHIEGGRVIPFKWRRDFRGVSKYLLFWIFLLGICGYGTYRGTFTATDWLGCLAWIAIFGVIILIVSIYEKLFTKKQK